MFKKIAIKTSIETDFVIMMWIYYSSKPKGVFLKQNMLDRISMLTRVA